MTRIDHGLACDDSRLGEKRVPGVIDSFQLGVNVLESADVSEAKALPSQNAHFESGAIVRPPTPGPSPTDRRWVWSPQSWRARTRPSTSSPDRGCTRRSHNACTRDRSRSHRWRRPRRQTPGLRRRRRCQRFRSRPFPRHPPHRCRPLPRRRRPPIPRRLRSRRYRRFPPRQCPLPSRPRRPFGGTHAGRPPIPLPPPSPPAPPSGTGPPPVPPPPRPPPASPAAPAAPAAPPAPVDPPAPALAPPVPPEPPLPVAGARPALSTLQAQISAKASDHPRSHPCREPLPVAIRRSPLRG